MHNNFAGLAGKVNMIRVRVRVRVRVRKKCKILSQMFKSFRKFKTRRNVRTEILHAAASRNPAVTRKFNLPNYSTHKMEISFNSARPGNRRERRCNLAQKFIFQRAFLILLESMDAFHPSTIFPSLFPKDAKGKNWECCDKH